MPKNETIEIQRMLVELGSRLGFDAHMEEQIHGHDAYAPIYDVVWYLKLHDAKMDSMKPMFGQNTKWFNMINRIPFAGFEVEGSTTSSKNQLSNFANLYSGNFIFNFVVVNNAGAGNENDTYRRGIKLNRYFNDFAGFRNTVFIDKIHLEKSIKALKEYDTSIELKYQKAGSRGTYGGETASIPIFEQIIDMLEGTRLQLHQNWTPDTYTIKHQIMKNVEVEDDFSLYAVQRAYYPEPYNMELKKARTKTDSYYIPKLDVVMGFDAPIGFVEWLKCLAAEMKNTIIDSPILYALHNKLLDKLFIPLISIEIESSINKHLNGGIFNMSKNSFLGILVTKEDATKHLQFFKQELGIKNVISYCVGGKS